MNLCTTLSLSLCLPPHVTFRASSLNALIMLSDGVLKLSGEASTTSCYNIYYSYVT